MTGADKQVLEKILGYCDVIEQTIERFGDRYELFSEDIDYRNSISMSLLQIGELAKHLSSDFEAQSTLMRELRGAKGMRDHFAHGYDSMSVKIVWRTMHESLPRLKKEIEAQLKDED